MAVRDQPDHVVGVYYDSRRQRWQVRLVRAGASKALSYADEAEARREAEGLRAEIARAQAQTVGALVRDWLATQGGLSVRTRSARLGFLGWLLPAEMTAVALGRAQGGHLLASALERGARSVATQREAVKVARQFCAWLCRERGLPSNPFDGVKVVGRPRRGDESHPQLTRDQVSAWLRAAHERTDPPSLCAVCCFLLGRRVGDLLGAADRRSVRVGDLDVGRGVLRGVGKGRAPWSSRLPSVPEYPDLQDRLAALAGGRGADEPLWLPMRRVKRPGLGDQSVRDASEAISLAAKVPRVTPHGLRGTLATLAAEADVPLPIAAQALGHGTAVHQQHYAQADATAQRSQSAGLRGLRG